MIARSTKNSGNLSKTEEPVSKHIPYTHHIDDTTLQTKDGYLLKTIKLEGLSFETTDQADLNHIKNVRAAMLRGLSSSRFALYHHIMRRQERDNLDSMFENEWCAALDNAYKTRLAQKRLFINEQFITVVRRPAKGPTGFMAELVNSFFGKMDKIIEKERHDDNLKALNEAVTNLTAVLSHYRPELLGIKETEHGIFSKNLSFLSYLINLEKNDIRLPCGGIAEYLPFKRISFGRESFEIRGAAPGDIRLGAMLSLKEYADGTGPGMTDSLLRLPHEFVLSQSFGFVDRQAALSVMRDTKRKLIAGEEGASSLEEEMDKAIDDLASGHASFGEHHLSIAVTGRNASELDRAVSDCIGAFTNLGIVTVREDINLEPAFWAQLPGNFSMIARRALISNKNFAGFASLHNFPSGRKAGNHWGDAITKLETTSGTPYWFNFHTRDVGNFTIIGPTGTGKTVLLTFLNAQAQHLKPRTIYFDKNRGAEIYLRVIGANYTAVKSGIPTGFNPLQLPDTPENRSFLRDWIRLLLTIDHDEPLSAHDIELIADAVNANFEEPLTHRRLHFLSELLAGHETQHKISLSSRIAVWHGNGERAWLFDNKDDVLSLENSNIGFDLTSILDDRISRTPWLLYVFHRIAQCLDGKRTIIMLDEGWKMLDDPLFALRIKDWMKTIRKQNGMLGFATQSAKDALNSSVGDAIIEQSSTQIFLPNARALENDYCEGFGLSRREWKIIRELSPESRCFLLRHGTESVIARLDLSGLENFISVLSGRTGSVRFMHELMDRYGEKPEFWLPYFLKEIKQ